MTKTLHRMYLRFRSPRTFLIALATFISSVFVLHYMRGYDPDWGGTNLTLSIEASVASAVINVGIQEVLDIVQAVLKTVQTIEEIARKLEANDEVQAKTLRGVMLIAEAQRDALIALQGHQNESSQR